MVVQERMNARELLDRHYLEVRARLLEVAATLDRIQRAADGDVADPRLQQIRQAIDVLQSDSADRAEQIQLLFSLYYDPDWRATFRI